MRGVLLAIVIIVLLFFTFIAGFGCGLLVSGDDSFTSGDKVAVLKVEEIILDSAKYLESITKIKKDKNIKAVVVRINSPGGAVGPSQEIFSELNKLRDTLPVIASIGGVGASGGYYIACSAEKIYANPGTITGSIGVIAQFASYEKLLEWAKVDVEVITSGEFKDVGSPFREMTNQDKKYIQELIDNVHTQFKTAVAESRDMDMKEVNAVADGKIFTGEQALELKLIDELGTITDAVAYAGKLGGIEGDPPVINYPKKRSQLYELLNTSLGTYGLSVFPTKARFGLFYLVDIIN